MILDNPFHVLGLTANCSAREKARRESRINAYLSVDKPLVFENDLYFSGCRRNEGTVKRAIDALHDARDRIGFGLFWFVNQNDADERGLRHLYSRDLTAAYNEWRMAGFRSVTASLASTLNNYGTVCLLIALADKSVDLDTKKRLEFLERGIRAKAKLVGHLPATDLAAFCEEFSHDIAARDPDRIVEVFAEAIERFKSEVEQYLMPLPVWRLVEFLGAGGDRLGTIKKRIASGPRQELERAVRQCEEAYENNKLNAAAAGQRLIKSAKEHLPILASIVTEADFAYTSIADKVASELLDTAIVNCNYHVEADSDSIEIARDSLALAEYAVEIACGSVISARAEDTLKDARRFVAKNETEHRLAAAIRPLKAWIARAVELKEGKSGSHSQYSLISKAVTRRDSNTSSPIYLLSALKREGIAVRGPEFRSDNIMIEYASMVCGLLVSSAVDQVNENPLPERKVNSLRLLIEIHRCFTSEKFARYIFEFNSDERRLIEARARRQGINHYTFELNRDTRDFLNDRASEAREMLESANIPFDKPAGSGSGCAFVIALLLAVCMAGTVFVI